MKLNVCVAGITGWVGKALAEAIVASDDLLLSGGVSRKAAGKRLCDVVPNAGSDLRISSSVADTLASATDVLVDYTKADVVRKNVLTAIAQGVHVVIGSSGLTDQDFDVIDRAAREKNVGVIAAGNFAITAVLLQRFACEAAKYVSQFEIIDYGMAAKPDAPSGTARELSYRLAEIRKPEFAAPVSATIGDKEARGATLNGIQMHSVRLPGFVSSIEVLFGSTGERLSIRHDSTDSAEPYIGGTLLAIRNVGDCVGVVRGLDKIID
jgi:4-hydroxy-tetrahydrodipicolinate reductase